MKMRQSKNGLYIVCVCVCVSLLDLVILCVNMLSEVQGLLMEAQEPVLQLLPRHPRDVLSRPSILIHR